MIGGRKHGLELHWPSPVTKRHGQARSSPGRCHGLACAAKPKKEKRPRIGLQNPHKQTVYNCKCRTQPQSSVTLRSGVHEPFMSSFLLRLYQG
eukprot:2579217-Rhodomonas_salina.1